MVTKLSEVSQPSSMATSSENTPVMFKHGLPMKFNNENHLLSKQQVLATVKGHKLTHFFESIAKPSMYLLPEDEANGNVN